MFTRRRRRLASARGRSDPRPGRSWSTCSPRSASSSRSRACPVAADRPQRQPGRRRSAAVVAVRHRVLRPSTSTTWPPILVAIAVGTAVGVVGAQRVQMTQMPQMVALFNGVGGGAAALVALLELRRDRRRRGGADVPVRPGGHGVHDRGRLGLLRRLDGHLRQAAGADDVPAGGLPRPAGRLRRVARRRLSCLRVLLVARPGACGRASCSRCSASLLGVLLVLPVGGADVPIVISLLNAFTGLTVAAGGYVLGNTLLLVAGTLVGASGTFLTLLMAGGDGPLGRQHPVRRAQGRLDPRRRRGVRPAGPVGRARGRRDPARLRRPGDHRARLRAGRRPGPAHAARAGRRARRARHHRSTTRSTRSPAGCPAT